MRTLFGRYSRQLAEILRRYKAAPTGSIWRNNAFLESQVNQILEDLDRDFKDDVLTQGRAGMQLSQEETDRVTSDFIKGVELSPSERERMFFRNTEALEAWLAGNRNGLDLSSRVWNLDNQAKDQIELLISQGLVEGRDAQSLARDLQKFLINPDTRFRRLRDESGKLILSAPAKLYRPGRGIYRSAHKNALRVARNETNNAYRRADFDRRRRLPFVKGIRIQLSNAHPRYDICDELVGLYPKDFIWTGWHVNCLCFSTTVNMSKREFIKFLNSGVKQTQDIQDIPKRARDHINLISDKLKKSKNPPYWLRDNFLPTRDGFVLDLKRPEKRSQLNFDFNDPDAIRQNVNYARRNGLDSNQLYRDEDGNLYPERAAYLESIVREYQDRPSESNNVVYMMGGATANGKSTVLEASKNSTLKSSVFGEFLPNFPDVVQMDSDQIKSFLPEYEHLLSIRDKAAAAFAHEESSILNKTIIRDLLEKGTDFILDGTNDGNWEKMRKKLEMYRDGGRNRLVAHYVTLDTDLSLRIANIRGENTGRFVPEDFVRSVNEGIPNTIRNIVAEGAMDELYLWDTNTQGEPKLILRFVDGQLDIYDRQLLKRFLRKGNNLPGIKNDPFKGL